MEKGVDARLYDLWRLLSAVGENRSHYAIADLSPLEPMLGGAVVLAFGEALMTYWRQWSPALRSERPSDKRNSISALDCIGIVGVTLEAVNRPDWANALTHDDAVRAAVYGTLELNGFPSWFVSSRRPGQTPYVWFSCASSRPNSRGITNSTIVMRSKRLNERTWRYLISSPSHFSTC